MQRYKEAISAYDAGLNVDPSNEALLNGKNQAEQADQNPTPSMGGMPGGMGGMGGLGGGGGMGGLLQQLLMSNPELLQDPEVMAALNDQTLMGKLKMYEQTGNIQAMFSDPQVSSLMQKFQNKVKKPEGFEEKANDFVSGHGHDPNSINKPKEEPKKEEPKKEEPKKELLKLKEKATNLFKSKKFNEAKDA